MNKNDIVRLTLTDQNNLGNGVGRLDDGRVVFVPGGVAGDTVTAKIIKVNSKFCVARLESVDEPSEFRSKEDFCTAPESCGGCVYRHITYEQEMKLKHDYVAAAFRKAGLFDARIAQLRTTGKTVGYRNKAQYPVANVKGRLTAGFFAAKTHKIVPCKACPLQPELFADIVDFVCKYAETKGVTAYDEITESGALRHIYIRSGEGSGEVMVCLVLRYEHSAFDAEFAEKLTNAFPQIKSVMLNYNRRNTNVVTGEEYKCIGGREYIEDILCGIRFRIMPSAFWQVNHDGAELLYGIAAEKAELTGNERLLDLYCGTGSIGLSMSKGAKSLVGIEIVPDAVECARINAEQNGIENAEFYCGDASDTNGILAAAERASGKRIEADVVIIDPPRKGTTPELIEYIAQRKIERVVYVSCNPDTLARDCSEFAKHGYTINGEVVPVDMFPKTGHVESVVCLTRRLDN